MIFITSFFEFSIIVSYSLSFFSERFFKLLASSKSSFILFCLSSRFFFIFGNYLSGAMRNPSAAQKQFPNLLLGFALAEATGLIGLVVALIILFAF